MPRFYFNVHEGGQVIPDADGLDLADTRAAEQEAFRAAAEIGKEVISDGRPADIVVEVFDADRQLVFSVLVSASLKRWRPDA